jgi:hypothetical protein
MLGLRMLVVEDFVGKKAALLFLVEATLGEREEVVLAQEDADCLLLRMLLPLPRVLSVLEGDVLLIDDVFILMKGLTLWTGACVYKCKWCVNTNGYRLVGQPSKGSL